MPGQERGCHALIALNFGDGRINMNFDPQQRQWSVKNNQDEGPSDTNSVIPESVISGGQNQLQNLQDKQSQLTKQLMVLQDIKQRLQIQAMISKMVVAEGIKDFHEQMEILLDRKITVD